jgi:predicted metalloprotease with PDZ domain
VKRFSISVLAALLLAFPACAEPVRYVLSPVIENGALKALAVDIDFTANADGVTRLRFIGSFQGDTHPGRFAEGLVVTGADRIAPLDGEQTEIRSAPGAALHARYQIRSAYDAPPNTQDARQTKPVVLPDWFYATGEVVFAFPAGRRDEAATFAWRGAPEGFRFASDLTQPGPRTVEDVLHAILIGSPRLRLIEGADARIAALGAFDHFDDPTFADATFRIIRAEREFWGDNPSPFLVTLAPLVPKVFEHYSGTGRTDGFALWVGTSLSLAEVYPLLAHEYFHTWNSGQLGAQAADRSSAWLSEGFTDFYTKRLLLRAGLFGLEAYAASWNAWLLAYGASPERNVTEKRLTEVYWQDQGVEDIAYKRGAMLAALFDAQLRRDGRTLDMVMRWMRLLKTRDAESGLRANFETAFQKMGGRSPLPDIERYEIRGETLTLPADAFACLTLSTVTQPIFDVGFDTDATAQKGLFAGVDPAGPAYAAGLRDGMKRLGREGGAAGDSSVELAYRVTDAAGQERVIRYKPEGKARVTFQKLSVPAGLSPEDEKACVRTLAGFLF